MKSIERFYEEEPEDLNLFYNGKYDFWHEMPRVNRDKKIEAKVLKIDFDSNEQILEFYKMIEFREKWDGTKDILPAKALQFRVRFPNNLMDKKRNTNYRFIHEQTLKNNPELYELMTLEDLHYDE